MITVQFLRSNIKVFFRFYEMNLFLTQNEITFRTSKIKIMEARHQIEITMYSTQYGHKKSAQQTVKWLETIMPVIMKTQKMVAHEIFLKGSSQMIRFCLS